MSEWRPVWRAQGFDLSVEKAAVRDQEIHRIIAVSGKPSAVAVCVHAHKVLLIRHERPVTGQILWEFPRGFGDAGDSDPVASAIRELKEETGLSSHDAQSLGRIWADSGLLGNPIEIVLIRLDPHSRAVVGGEGDGEARGFRFIDPHEMDSLIAAGRMSDGITLASWSIVRSHLR